MKRMLSFVLGLAVLVGLVPVLPTQAADNKETSTVVSHTITETKPKENAKRWRYTATVRVLENNRQQLTVEFPNPDKLAIERTDQANAIQTVPLERSTTFLDKQGKSLTAESILPGQTVRLTMVYRWEGESPRFLVPVRAVTVALTEDTIDILPKARRTLAEIAAEKGTLQGTVLSVDKQKKRAAVYVDAGFVAYGENTLYFVRGEQSLPLNASLKITDSTGKKGELAPGQRVKITVKEGVWAESMPPQFSLAEASDVIILTSGRDEQVYPAQMMPPNKPTAVVKEKKKDTNGTSYLVVEIAGTERWELAYGAAYRVYDNGIDGTVISKAGKSIPFQQLQIGDTLSIYYEGISIGTEYSTLDWYHQIQILP